MTLLKIAIDAALAEWTAQDPETRPREYDAVMSAHQTFIREHGMDRFALEVVQPGGRLMMLGIGEAFDVLHRNQLLLLRHAGMIPMEPTT